MVIFDNVKKFILHDVDLHIPRGITLGIIGASGAGKTTFLKLISGILEPESGVVRTLRRDPVEKAGGFLRRISVLFADIPVFDERLSIIDCLEEIRIMYRMKQREYNERLDYISETLDTFIVCSRYQNSKFSAVQRHTTRFQSSIRNIVDDYVTAVLCVSVIYRHVTGSTQDAESTRCCSI